MDFDPNNSAPQGSGLFALPYTVDDATIVIVPVPWDATSSQGRMSSGAPDAVSAASMYVELFDPRFGSIYRKGIAMDAVNDEICALNVTAVGLQECAAFDGIRLDRACERLNEIVRIQVADHLHAGKQVGLLGGDHSVSYGAIEAHLAKYPDLGILQIDAHCDLRNAFDGITYSHASIMYNVLEKLGAPKLIQAGIRGLCDFEAQYLEQSDRVRTFFDFEIQDLRARGTSWASVCDKIIAELPCAVYVSLDVDGLDPASCPHTGTPVPGGLSYNDVLSLLHQVVASGRKVIGFDLVEVGADGFDASIAAHLLYQLCGVVGRQG